MTTLMKPHGGYVTVTDSYIQTEMGRQYLTKKQSVILTALIEAAGKSVSLLKLQKLLGHNSEVLTTTVRTHIYNIRQLLENIEEFDLILTKEYGYALNVLPAAIPV